MYLSVWWTDLYDKKCKRARALADPVTKLFSAHVNNNHNVMCSNSYKQLNMSHTTWCIVSNHVTYMYVNTTSTAHWRGCDHVLAGGRVSQSDGGRADTSAHRRRRLLRSRQALVALRHQRQLRHNRQPEHDGQRAATQCALLATLRHVQLSIPQVSIKMAFYLFSHSMMRRKFFSAKFYRSNLLRIILANIFGLWCIRCGYTTFSIFFCFC